MTDQVARLPWWQDDQIIRQLPRRYQLYGRYFSIAPRRRGGAPYGGAFLLRCLARLDRGLRLDDEVELRLDQVVLAGHLRDARIFAAIEEARGHDAEGRLLSALLSPGDTFLDVGANHGGYALAATRLIGRSGLVLAFEPQPRLAGLVRSSLTKTARTPFEVHEVACGSQAGEAELFIPDGHSGSGSVHRDFLSGIPHTGVRVLVRALDDLVDPSRLPGRTVIKLDVEGSEFAALQGARRLLAESRPPLIFELAPRAIAAARRSVDELLGLLEEVGYSHFGSTSHFPRTGPSDGLDVATQQNVLALTAEDAARLGSPAKVS